MTVRIHVRYTMKHYAVTRGAFRFGFFIQNQAMESIEAQIAARVARLKRTRLELTPTGLTPASKQQRPSGESARPLRNVVPGHAPPVSKKSLFPWKPWTREEDLNLCSSLSRLRPQTWPPDNRRLPIWQTAADEFKENETSTRSGSN